MVKTSKLTGKWTTKQVFLHSFLKKIEIHTVDRRVDKVAAVLQQVVVVHGNSASFLNIYSQILIVIIQKGLTTF